MASERDIPTPVPGDEPSARPRAPRSRRATVAVAAVTVALVLTALVALPRWRERRARGEIAQLLLLLDHGDTDGARAGALDVRAHAPSAEVEREAEQVAGAAVGLAEVLRLETHLATDLELGATRILEALLVEVARLEDHGDAGARAGRWLRDRMSAAVAQSGAPRAGRDTVAGARCLALALLAASPDEGLALHELAAACSPRLGAWAGVTAFTDPVDGARMVLVPGGTFRRGMSPDTAQQLLERYGAGMPEEALRRTRNWLALSAPAHEVRVSSFYVERCEVTNARYAGFIDANGYGEDRYWCAAGREWRDDKAEPKRAPAYWGAKGWSEPALPVVGVSWFEADAYARFAHKELPTEAQWEKAARGADFRAYPWGEEWLPGRNAGAEHWAHTLERARFPDPVAFADLAAWTPWRGVFVGWNPHAGPVYLVPADSMTEGASPCGALHLSGNVSEWCRDWFDDKWFAEAAARADDAAGPAEEFMRDGEKVYLVQKAVRGGHFDKFRMFTRADLRYWDTPGQQPVSSGFRCVLGAGPRDK